MSDASARPRLSAILASKRALFATALLALVAVNAQTLDDGLYGDDLIHRRFALDHLQGRDARLAIWNMFDGRLSAGPSDPDPPTLLGRLPWWASPELSFALFRPLSAMSHILDYWLWPGAPWVMHLHNLILFALCAWLAGELYVGLLGRGAAAWLALLLFVLDDANTITAAWVASRNTLLTALFVLLTFWLHRARAQARTTGAVRSVPAWLPPLALLCAHASSEGALVAWAYLVPHALLLDPRPWAARMRALLPLALVSISWLALSSSLGYGVRGSGIYLDPRHEPWLFVEAAIERLPRLLLTQLSLPPEYADLLPPQLRDLALGASGVLLALLLAGALWFGRRDRRIAFFALAVPLAMLPLCATMNAVRLLLLSALAAHGLTALVFWHVAGRLRVRGTIGKLGLAGSVAALTFVHGVVAVQLPPHGLAFARLLHDVIAYSASSLPRGPELAGSTLVVLNFPDYLRGVFVAMYRRELFAPGPERMHVLGVSPSPVRLTRTGSHTLELAPAGGYLLEASTGLVRRPREAFQQGQRFDLGQLRVVVSSVTADGRPERIRVECDDLADPGLLWVSWSEPRFGFESVELPPPGGSTWLGQPATAEPSPDRRHATP